MSLSKEERRLLSELEELCARAAGRGLRRLEPGELARLPRLYRHACTALARLETTDEAPALQAALTRLVARAHGLLHRAAAPRRDPGRRVARFFLAECPRAIRSEWRLVGACFALVYGLAIAAYAAVSRDLDLAFVLLDPGVVQNEIEQLESTPAGEPFRGNFNFGLGESPATAGWITVHNIGVGITLFAASLIPPLYALLIGLNALMLGTYTAVAGHWGQAGSISSILWCHGTLEIQALILAGAAGMVLVRGALIPGPWTRRHALARGAHTAWRVLAPMFPMLVASGLIEGFISPHAPAGVRLAVAGGTGLLLVLWLLLGGRRPGRSTAP